MLPLHGRPQHRKKRQPQAIIGVFQYRGDRYLPIRSRVFLLSDVPEFLHLLFSSLIFCGLTAQVIPLRSGLHVFCFVGSALNNTVFPPTKQTLACDATQSELESPTGLKYAGLDEKSLCNYRTSRCPCGLQCC
jgi:hypothetical protein